MLIVLFFMLLGCDQDQNLSNCYSTNYVSSYNQPQANCMQSIYAQSPYNTSSTLCNNSCYGTYPYSCNNIFSSNQMQSINTCLMPYQGGMSCNVPYVPRVRPPQNICISIPQSGYFENFNY